LASEIKALLTAGVPVRWDRDAFFHTNHFLVVPQDRTLFDGIYQVPPGRFLLATGGHVRLIRYCHGRDGIPDSNVSLVRLGHLRYSFSCDHKKT
jgi:asparagine synthase (glutamine-hydrolysing)